MVTVSGECAQLVATIDWSRTAIGPRPAWPASLRSRVSDILASRQPMLLFWGPELVQLYNDAFVPSFGAGKHPVAMGQRAAECWADAWPVVGAQIEAVLARGEPAWFADALVPIERNGRTEEVYWTYSYSPAFDDEDRIAGVLVIVTEMTDRVLAARRLAALASLGEALARASSRGEVFTALAAAIASERADLPFVVVVEQHGGGRTVRQAIGIASQAAERIGAEAARAAAPAEIALASPVAAEPWPEPVTRAFVSALPARRPDASLTITFGLSPRLPFDDRMRSYLQQITDRVAATLSRIDHADASRAIEQERDHLLLQAPVAAALLVGPDLVYQLANARYREMVSRDPTGKRFAEAFPELVGSEVQATFERVYRTGEPFVATEQLVPLARNGALEDRWFHYAIEPLRAVTGEVHGMMVVAVDVSEQVGASRAKDEFLAMLGHELRNPLAPIVAAVELMKRKEGATVAERETIERQLAHVVRLVDDLLDVARITRGKIDLVRRPIAIAGVVERAVEIARTLIDQRGHRLEVDVEREAFVDGDQGRLVQVVVNLLTNAARYTPPGGSIRVTARRAGVSVVLQVIDDGVGMDRELAERAFDLFVQGKRGVDRADGGLGIGLAIVKNLVSLHGGAARAHSEGPGKGTEVTIELPTCEAPRPSSQALASVGFRRARHGKRVMIVDDNDDAAMLLGELLRTCGHEPAIAHDGPTALRMFDEMRPDVAVLDIGLPEMSGYELAGEVRARGGSCRLIALTGYGQETDRERARAAGFDAHFVKPVAIERLLAALDDDGEGGVTA